ncbi:hypothetical protein SprV_0100271000 [Sparganum proliferum]
MARKAEETQGYADWNASKNIFAAINAIYGPTAKGTVSLLSSDGSRLLTENSQILKRWEENFRNILNRPSALPDAAIARLPQVKINFHLDLPASLPETIRSVQQLSSGKTPSSNTIPTKIYKHDDHRQDLKDATTIRLYKRKWNRQLCDNHRGISLLKTGHAVDALDQHGKPHRSPAGVFENAHQSQMPTSGVWWQPSR